MITFNDLYDALRKERYSQDLQLISDKFIEDAFLYFEEKKKLSEKESDVFSDIAIKSKKKLENAITNFRELLRIRRKKILNLAFIASEVGISKKDFENLLSFEKQLFEEIVKSFEKADKNLNKMMVGEKKEKKYRLVRFLENVGEFLGADGTPVGGFEKGEVVNLDKEIVEILEKDQRVEVLDV